MTEFNYNDIIEYIDGTRDLHLEEAIKWAKENMAYIEEIGLKDGAIRQFKIIEMPYEEKIEKIRRLRAEIYIAKVDPLMNEYNRKKTFNLFEESEEERLRAEIEAKVADIKANNPYPAEPIEKIEELPVFEENSEAEATVSEMENTEE